MATVTTGGSNSSAPGAGSPVTTSVPPCARTQARKYSSSPHSSRHIAVVRSAIRSAIVGSTSSVGHGASTGPPASPRPRPCSAWRPSRRPSAARAAGCSRRPASCGPAPPCRRAALATMPRPTARPDQCRCPRDVHNLRSMTGQGTGPARGHSAGRDRPDADQSRCHDPSRPALGHPAATRSCQLRARERAERTEPATLGGRGRALAPSTRAT